MAKKKDGPQQEPQASPAPKEAEKKHSNWERIWELSQNFAIIGGIILGLRQPPKAGEQAAGGKEIPGWLMNLFPSFTREDETEFNLILDSHTLRDAKQIEAVFRDNFITDGFDETKYRLGLVHFRREYLERMRNPMPENKSGGQLIFKPLQMKDSASEFIDQLIDIHTNPAGGTDQEKYACQKKIALDRKLLEKTSLLKKVFSWTKENKGKTVALFFTIPLFLFSLFILFLNIMLG